MPDIELILKAAAFIESHLEEEITVADMAASVSSSIYHFSRSFSRATGHAPYDYLMRRRLSEAARSLLTSTEKIIDVAFRYQFKAPETFSRAFKRMFNLQPRQARVRQSLDHRCIMAPVSRKYLEFIHQNSQLTPEMKKMSRLRIAGVAAPIDALAPDRTVPSLWRLLQREIPKGGQTPIQRNFYGIKVHFSPCSDCPYMYLAGYSLMEDEEVPIHLVEKNIASLNYASFKLMQTESAAGFTRRYIYHTWWPKAVRAGLPPLEIEWLDGHKDCQINEISVLHPQTLYLPLECV